MASNNIIFAVPSANSSVDYKLPESESAKLSFSPEDIDGLKLDGTGGLVISFVEGGSVTISNFQSFIDNGNTLSLADGTQVDPKLLFNALGGQNDNPFPANDVTNIGIPADGTTHEITLESGKKYLMNFDLSETQGADIKDGSMTISFANGGKIVIPNYETAMADKLPPELSLASKTCVVTGDELITNIKALASAGVPTEDVVIVEEETTTKHKSKLATADMHGNDDIGANHATDLGYKAEKQEPKGEDVAKVEPAAGEADIARELANIETAAGGPAGGTRNSGYGYGSRPGADPFTTNPDIGPIDPTSRDYVAPVLQPSQILTIPNAPINDNPIATGPNLQTLDETDLSGGPISKSGKIVVDYGNDGPGGINPDGAFSSDGSKTGGVLSHNGVPIDVTVVGNSYVGTAGGEKIFDLVIDPLTGDYKFTQYDNIDHANGNNPNDQIGLHFGIIAHDGDGDSVSTSVNIIISDDAPSIEGAHEVVDETDLGPVIETGNLVHNFGQDGAGTISTTGTFSMSGSMKDGVLSSNGHAIAITATADGYKGVADGVVIFTLTLTSNGAYTYTQYGNLDHANPNDPNDIIRMTFGAKITDYDGDSVNAPITIDVKDDAPRFVDCGCHPDDPNPTPGDAVEIVDETNLGPIVETGRLVVEYGVDAPGSMAFKTDGFTAGGSLKGDALTHNGVPVVVTLVDGNYVGKAGDVTVFTLTLDKSTGDYKFTLLDNLDHKDGSNPDDVINLKFTVLASDSEGDTVEGSITVQVKDDAPTAHDDHNTYDTSLGIANGNVISGLNGGATAPDHLSQDEPNTVVKISFGGHDVDVPASGTVSIDGDHGTLTISADGTYSYTAFELPAGAPATEKHFTAGPALPDFEGQLTPAEQQALGIAPGNLAVQAGDVVHINFVKETGQNHNGMGVFMVDADGNLKMEQILVKDTETANAQTFDYTATSDSTQIGFFVVSGWDPINPAYDAIDFSKGSLDFVFDYGKATERPAKDTDDSSHIKLIYTGEDGTETTVPGPIYFTSERGDTHTMNPDGEVRVVSGVPDGDDTVLQIGFEDYKDGDFNDVIFNVGIISKGDCGCKDDIKDEFTYTLKDGDGDTSTAVLDLSGKDLTDDHPIFVGPAAETVDETNLTTGVITETGAIVVNFGHDGPGFVNAAGTFTSDGSRTNNALTSGGVPVVVGLVGDTYKGVANGVTIFTLTINLDGTYSFKLYEQLDHANGNDANDIINLNFGVMATDCDGDITKTTLTVHVKDDAPVANDDTVNVNEGGVGTGNVTGNDVPGQDTPASVTKVTYNGTDYTVPAVGNVTIAGVYGTLVIDHTGAYTYTAKSNVSADGSDKFTYTLRDNDGDTDPAILQVNVKNGDDTPEIIKPADETVDETNLSTGVITETGTVTANFFSDGPGTFSANGSFASSGSKLGDALTHNGVPVTVNTVGNTYTGTAGGVTIFTLTVNADGSYSFKLYENLDHKDGSNANDVIDLNFGVKATDKDGDSADTTLTVHVKDDAPSINGGSGTVDETNLTAATPLVVAGNLTHSYGQDGAGSIVIGTAAAFEAGGSLKSGVLSSGGSPITVTATADGYVGKTAGGAIAFTLTINTATGEYEYKQFKNLDHADASNPNDEITLKFDAKITDFDGDSAKAPIVITVRDDAPSFPPENPDNPPEDPQNPPPGDPNHPAMGDGYKIVDESNLTPSGLTTTGHLNAHFGADAPGSYASSGSFTSTGSKTGGALTSNGVPVVVSLENGNYVGKAGSVVVFTLVVNATTGDYTFTLKDTLDHANGSNPNDVINLNFGVDAKDSEGDAAHGTIRIDVKDDAPVANDDTVTVNEGGTAAGNVVVANDAPGHDLPATVSQVSYNGTTYTVPPVGNLVIVAEDGTLSINASGAYTYVAKSNLTHDAQDDFTYTLRDYDGDTDPAVLSVCVTDGDDTPQIIMPANEIVDETNLSGGVITETGKVTANFFNDGPGTFGANGSFASSGSKLGGALTHEGVPVTVNTVGNTYTGTAGGVTIFTLVVNTDGSYTFKLYEQLDHADANDANDIINLTFGVKATDNDGDSASTTLTVQVKDDAPVANDDTTTMNEGGVAHGNVKSNDSDGQDVVANVTKIVYNGTTFTVPDSGNVTIAGAYGTLVIDHTGAYTYTAKSNVNNNGQDDFQYTLRDNDGDIDTATLTVCVNNNDDTPVIVPPAAEAVDETNLTGGAITETGKIIANFGNDGPGAFAANGSFASNGSRLGNVLSSHGVPVSVSSSGDTYTGKAGGVTIFTLTVNADGSYTFKLYEQLDHADGSNANDVINLNFGIKATDVDGDSANTTLTVQVLDDAPVAKPDFCTVLISQGQLSSNMIGNDVVGQDAPGRIMQITFGGHTVDVPASGSVSIASLYGLLTISADGAYTYKITDGNAPSGTENFTVKLADYDGDTSSTNLQINLVGDDHQGTGGSDTLYGTSGNDIMHGNDGGDWLYGQAGNDTIYGDNGPDYLDGGTGNDTINGGEGNDDLIGRQGDDTIYGGEGGDNLYGDGGTADTYVGNDKLYGEGGDDYIFAGAGNDYLDGGTGNDALYGWDGNDTIIGGAGNDDLIGGKGADILTGGAGADKFWFMNVNEGVDHITDFKIGEGDKLELSNVITNFDPVTDAINDFVFATHDAAGNTTILVNNAGTGIAGATALAVLEGVNVTVTDLFNSGAIIH